MMYVLYLMESDEDDNFHVTFLTPYVFKEKRHALETVKEFEDLAKTTQWGDVYYHLVEVPVNDRALKADEIDTYIGR